MTLKDGGGFDLFTAEHALIADAVSTLFADLSAEDEQARQQRHVRIGAAEVGAALSELGLFSREPDDAAMWSARVQVAVAREAGAAALTFPVLESLAAHALGRRAGLDAAGAGPSFFTIDSDTGLDATRPSLRGGRLTGVAPRVPFVNTVGGIWLRVQGEREGRLALIAPNATGVQCRPRASVEEDYVSHDLDVRDAAPVSVLDTLEDGAPALAFVDLRVALLAAAEIAGACRRMVLMTRDYLLVRNQFGQPLVAHQALRHAVADAYVKVEAMSTAVDYAAAACDAAAPDAAAAVHAAKHFAGRAGKTVADAMLQLHGAIGYTMEFPLHLLMRRVYRLGVSHGSGRQQAGHLFQDFLSHD